MTKIKLKNNVLLGGIHNLTSDYKTRNLNRRDHNGMDFVGENGIDEVIAVESGIVSFVGYDNTSGYWLSINSNDIEHRYFHLKKGTIKAIKEDYVVKGEVIATMGNSGNANGNHLHFAVYKNNQYVDPLPYLINNNPFNMKAEENILKKFVKGIQEVFGAKVDGIAGPETLSKTLTISTAKNWNHPAVKIIQEYLVNLGYDIGKLGIDGKFGPDMKKVIIEYQKNVVGLQDEYVDGIITARMYTWQKLLNL